MAIETITTFKAEEDNRVLVVDLIVLPPPQKVKKIWRNQEKDLQVVVDLPVTAKIEKITNKVTKEITPDQKVSKIKAIIIDPEAEATVNKIDQNSIYTLLLYTNLSIYK